MRKWTEMAQIVEFPTESGGTVLVEVGDRVARTMTRGRHGAEVAERAQQTFEVAVSRVQPAVQAVVAQLRAIAQAPDEIHVEFGLSLHAEAGAFIAAAGTTANFTVALTWRRNESRPTTP